MTSAIDTNVLLDILATDSSFAEASVQAVVEAGSAGRLLISEIVYAELAAASSPATAASFGAGSRVLRLRIPRAEIPNRDRPPPASVNATSQPAPLGSRALRPGRLGGAGFAVGVVQPLKRPASVPAVSAGWAGESPEGDIT